MKELEQQIINLTNELVMLKQQILFATTKVNKEWLSMKEACEIASCSPTKMRQLIEDGYVVASKSGNKGAHVVVSRKSINQYFESKIYKPAYVIKKRV